MNDQLLIGFSEVTITPEDFHISLRGQFYERIAEYVETVKPLTNGHIGFSPYCTMLKIKDIEVKDIYYETVEEGYKPEF